MTQPVSSLPTRKKAVWYREPYMWLVLGLPLAAVMGSITAAVISVKVMSNDPLLDKTPPPAIQLDQALLDKLTPEQREALEMSLTPARKARNHVASPELPKD
ncbi:hypothetical protein RZS08_09170 [Arthrospira platensis SPKY1]|nr:hypothetical protein [Arthrospira platensis SPKY1]